MKSAQYVETACVKGSVGHCASMWVRFGWAVSASVLMIAGGCSTARDVAESSAATIAEVVENFEVTEAVEPVAMSMTRHTDATVAVATEQAPMLAAHMRTLPSSVAKVEEVVPEAAAVRSPIEARTARQRLTVRIAPDHHAPRRARIPRGESFNVFEKVEGSGCAAPGWADIGNGGFVCLAKSRKTTRTPRTMPPVKGDGVMPFYFGTIREGETARRWPSMASYRAGDEPSVISAPGRHFAFVGRTAIKGTTMLVDKRGRVMMERDLRRFTPSRFSGRDLVAQPVPAQQQLAWANAWPETTVRESAGPDAPLAKSLDYHAEIYVKPEPIETAAGTVYALVDGGFVSARDIRRWDEPTALSDEDLAEDEIWIDVQIDQQTLTVMRGSTPIYATLISSGLKGPTPRGLFRINKKQAYGSMSSAPGASDPYAVEAVPYVQYFHGGIALHSAYWHNRFGHRASHGCVNLSPRDAAFVYSLTGPNAREGWLEVYEDEGDLGTRVRVRSNRDTAKVADRRGEVEHVFG